MDDAELPPDPAATPELDPEPAAVLLPSLTPAPVVFAPSPALSVPVPVPPPSHADRSTGLVVFGIVQIILGLLSALMIPLIAFAAVVSRLGPSGAMHPGQLLSATSTYAFAAVALVMLGIGSIQYRRWARALTLITSWYWLIMGTLITVLLTAVMPVAMRTALQSQQHTGNTPSPEISTAAMAIIVTLVIVFLAFFLIVVPIAFVVFDTRARCRRDLPRSRSGRTLDRPHSPARSAGRELSLFCWSAVSSRLVGVTTPIFPFFGRYLTGIPGAACFLVLAALDGYLAVATYRLNITGWWIAAITLPLRLLSMGLTYVKADLMQAYSQMGRSDAELRMLQSSPILRGHIVLWWSLLSLVVFFGYLLWIKRYFKPPAEPVSEPLPA